nr:hypothetical protein [Pandoravirus massiliensis]
MTFFCPPRRESTGCGDTFFFPNIFYGLAAFFFCPLWGRGYWPMLGNGYPVPSWLGTSLASPSRLEPSAEINVKANNVCTICPQFHSNCECDQSECECAIFILSEDCAQFARYLFAFIFCRWFGPPKPAGSGALAN